MAPLAMIQARSTWALAISIIAMGTNAVFGTEVIGQNDIPELTKLGLDAVAVGGAFYAWWERRNPSRRLTVTGK